MNRRRFLAGAGAAAVAAGASTAKAGLPVPAGGKIGFTVLRNGRPIGVHTITFEQNGDELRADILVQLEVKFAGLTLFHYHFSAVERWRGADWVAADSTINNNGKPIVVSARMVDNGYAIQGTEHPPYVAPPETRPATYWNKPALFGPLLNLQTAQTLHENITDAGWFNLPEPGFTLTAHRYDLTGKLNLSVYYDQTDAWAGLAFQRSGAITYEKMA